MTDIGARIADLRTDLGLSQQELADLLFVSRDLISKWENGTRRPDYPMIEAIAKVFNVPPDTVAVRSGLVFEELEDAVGDECAMSEDELAEAVGRFLKKINKNEAKLFVQRYYFLRSPSEISLLFGIKENHVRSLLSRTRRKLRTYIKEYKS